MFMSRLAQDQRLQRGYLRCLSNARQARGMALFELGMGRRIIASHHIRQGRLEILRARKIRREFDTRPPMTPLEAIAMFGDDPRQTILLPGGGEMTMDGPCMSPPKFWAPFIVLPDGSEWCVSGQPGDVVDRSSLWIRV